MSAKDTPVKGGVSILHQQVEGKHQYEVDHVVKYKKGWLGGGFVRKGDKLLKINGQNLEDVTPEVFAELLTTASPMLTVHQGAAKEKKKKCADRGGLYPFNKEKTCMRFSLEMMQEQQLDENGGGHHRGSSGGGDKGRPDCSGGLDDLLLISMRRASISIVKGRGCDPGSPCHDCGGAGCNFNDVVMVAESSHVTLVSRGITNFLREKIRDNILIQSLVHDRYIHRRDRMATMASGCQSSAAISIYYYKSDCVDGEYPGQPVVLNFTGTENFLNCSRNHENKAILTVETCDKQKLKNITNGSKETWPFVFYMKAAGDGSRRFESANCPGWFINANHENVAMECHEAEDETFFFIIRKSFCQ